MTRPRGFITDWQPRQKSLDLLTNVKEIMAEYQMALTVRQIFYRLVGRYDYPKTERAYSNLAELLTKARRAERIGMEAIRDDGFTNHSPLFFSDMDAFMADIRGWAEDFRLDRQRDQERRLVVMCEASGMALQLYQATQDYGIPVYSSGGFDSLTDKHRLADIWSRDLQPTTVLRIGDYDPSGQSMATVVAEDIGAFVEAFGGDVDFVQIAITPEQARDRNLPSAPPKETDRRGVHFNDSETWQAEALDPNDLIAILLAAIESRRDPGIYQDILDEEQEIRAALRERLADR